VKRALRAGNVFFHKPSVIGTLFGGIPTTAGGFSSRILERRNVRGKLRDAREGRGILKLMFDYQQFQGGRVREGRIGAMAWIRCDIEEKFGGGAWSAGGRM